MSNTKAGSDDVVVSVVMPAFNSAKHIVTAIESVLNQTFDQFEVLVVDGGSNDTTLRIVGGLSARDGRVRLIQNHEDKGPAHARCVGIKHSRGAYVAFLDADDHWLPNKLEQQLQFIERTGARFVYGRYRQISEDGTRVGCLVPTRRSYSFTDALSFRGIGTLTVMLDRSLLTNDVIHVWRRAGGEELLWWLLILKKGITAELLDRDVARYRITEGSLSKNLPLTVRTVWSMYRGELGLTRLRTAWHFTSYAIDSIVRRLQLRIFALIQSRCNQV